MQGTPLKLKPGMRLRSITCETQIIIVRPPKPGAEISCGGYPMTAVDSPANDSAQIDPAFANGTAIGKRYTDEAETFEVLCVRAGAGTLALGATPLRQKSARTLP